MKRNSLALTAGIALAGSTPVLAAASDYVFEPVKVEVKNGPGSELAVRLIHKPTGRPVKDAVVFRTRLDMSPDAMEAMTAKHEALPSSEAGIYRFKAHLTMEGGWAFKLMAKVQGEQETVTGTVVFKAKD